MDREAGLHNKQNIGYHPAPSGGRRVLSIAVNHEPVSSHRASIAAGFTFQTENLASYWPILIYPLAKSMPEAAGVFWKVGTGR